jgi:hypothetical protein
MRVDEASVQINGFLVVLGSFGELAKDEVQLRAVVVDIRVIFVVCDCQFEIICRCILVTWLRVSNVESSILVVIAYPIQDASLHA